MDDPRIDTRIRDLVAASDPLVGFYGPDSETWRIFRERAIFGGGPRALLLQLAHPAVAQGVVDHSAYREDTLGRARRTFEVMYTLTFGTCDEALAAASRMRRRHVPVRGVLPGGQGHYDARDPALLLWVMTTLIEGAYWVYDLLIEPLSEARRAASYLEIRRIFPLVGLDPDDAPETYAALRTYLETMMSGGALSVTPAGRETFERLIEGDPSTLVTTVFDLKPAWLRGLFDSRPVRATSQQVMRAWASAMLSPALRAGFGLTWGRRDRAVWAATSGLMRQTVKAMPPTLRYMPQYHAALARLSAASETSQMVPR